MTQMLQTQLMTTEIEQAYADLLQLDFAAYDVSLYLAAMPTDDGQYLYADVPLDAKLPNDLRAIVQHYLIPHPRTRQRRAPFIRQYDPEAQPDDGEIGYERTADAPDVMEYLSPLAASDLTFDVKDNAFTTRLRCYVIVLSRQDYPTIYCFRHYSAQKVLRHSRNLYAIFNEGRYSRLESPGILLDQALDCICWDQHIFIFDRAEYDKMFREGPHVKRAAIAALDILALQGIVDGDQFDLFYKACMRDKRKRARLRNIALKGRLAAKHLQDFDRIQSMLHTYAIDVEIINVDGDQALHYGKKGIWDMLKLLGDDFVQSPLTGNHYETNSKRPRG